jgi:uncharacterized protein (DUF2147 family)
MLLRTVLGLSILASLATAVLASDVNGEWARVDGKAKVRFAPCGGAICGTITWLKDPNGPAKIGQQVFFDMKPNGDNVWAGTAFNPDDAKKYTGKMTMSGDTLVTAGCIFGGLICQSVDWRRAR